MAGRAAARSAQVGADALEDEARRRAMGWDEPIYHHGRQVGTVRKYSDTLLIFLLKGLKPETYRERRETVGIMQYQRTDGATLAPAAVVNVTIARDGATVSSPTTEAADTSQ